MYPYDYLTLGELDILASHGIKYAGLAIQKWWSYMKKSNNQDIMRHIFPDIIEKYNLPG